MRCSRSYCSTAAGAALAACITAASAQDATDTLMRAAYCVGVLKESVKQAHKDLADAKAQVPACPTYSAQSHLWDNMKAHPEDCGTRLAFAIDMGQISADQQEARRQRYAQYLALRLSDMSGGQKSAVTALLLKGERDAGTQRGASDHLGVMRCLKSDHPTTAALVDCIAHHNQTFASVMRCQQMPDNLPF
jgi:hypothetical protein